MSCYLAECRTCGAFTGAVVIEGYEKDAEATAAVWRARGDTVRIGTAAEFREGDVCHRRQCEERGA